MMKRVFLTLNSCIRHTEKYKFYKCRVLWIFTNWTSCETSPQMKQHSTTSSFRVFHAPFQLLTPKPRQPDPDLWPHRSALPVSPGGSLTYAHPFSMWLLEGALFGAWFLPFSIHGAVCNKDICNKTIPQNEKKKKSEANIISFTTRS